MYPWVGVPLEEGPPSFSAERQTPETPPLGRCDYLIHLVPPRVRRGDSVTPSHPGLTWRGSGSQREDKYLIHFLAAPDTSLTDICISSPEKSPGYLIHFLAAPDTSLTGTKHPQAT